MTPFASNLKRRASELGLSSAEVSRRVGLEERRYGNYVQGRREPNLVTLGRIADTLQMTVDELLGRTAHDNASPLHDRLAVAAKALDNSELEMLVIQAEALARNSSKKPSR